MITRLTESHNLTNDKGDKDRKAGLLYRFKKEKEADMKWSAGTEMLTFTKYQKTNWTTICLWANKHHFPQEKNQRPISFSQKHQSYRQTAMCIFSPSKTIVV